MIRNMRHFLCQVLMLGLFYCSAVWAQSHKDAVDYYHQYSIDTLTKKAQEGDVKAQFTLGLAYSVGWEGVQKDGAQAFYWFEKAALQGSINAQEKLAVAYSNGYGISENQDLAKYWYLKTAEAGHPVSQFNVAVAYCYEKGRWWESDVQLCEYWLTQAGGYTRGDDYTGFFQYEVGKVYENESSVVHSIDKAITWFEKAAGLGSEGALSMLLTIYECSDLYGWEVSQERANLWVEMAANKNEEDAIKSQCAFIRSTYCSDRVC